MDHQTARGLFRRPIVPLYYIEDCRILTDRTVRKKNHRHRLTGQITCCYTLTKNFYKSISRFFHLDFIYVVQILVHSHFKLVSSLLALDATEPISQPVAQMAVEIINIHLISVSVKARYFFHLATSTNFERMLKSFWNSHLQMINRVEPLF